MQFTPPLIEATFMERPNRFLGIVDLDGVSTQCHIPNPGRMMELLTEGAKVYIQKKTGPGRKTMYDLILVEHRGVLVSVDSRTPNNLADEAITQGRIPEFAGYRIKKREHTIEDSRLDFLLEGAEGLLFLEVKSCTLIRDGVALFPDAPTKRGSRHLNTLQRCLRKGRAAVLLIIQRPDAVVFRPNAVTDPVFADTLKKVHNQGVEVIAYDCKVSTYGIWINKKIEVKIRENNIKEHKNTGQI